MCSLASKDPQDLTLSTLFLLSRESLAPFPSALLFTALCRDQNALACPLVLLTNASHLLTLTQASHRHKSFLRQKRKGMCFPQMHPKRGPCLFSPPSIIPDMMGALELERPDLPIKSGSVSLTLKLLFSALTGKVPISHEILFFPPSLHFLPSLLSFRSVCVCTPVLPRHLNPGELSCALVNPPRLC